MYQLLPRRLIHRLAKYFLVLSALGVGLASPAYAELRVVVTIKPIHSLVAGVMAGVGKPHLIVKGSASPHDFALKPSDASALQKASVVIRVSDHFETFLNSAIANVRKSSKIVVNLDEVPGIQTLPVRTGSAWSGAHHHNHDDDRLVDPHIWLAPKNAIVMVSKISAVLSRSAPSNATLFSRNAETMITRLHRLNQDMQTELKATQPRPFLVYHDAFQYFETAFKRPATGAISLGDSRKPGAQRIRRLHKLIRRKKIACVFIEPQSSPRLARVVISGTPARLAKLDAIGADIKPGPDAYFQLMRRNAKAFVNCFR